MRNNNNHRKKEDDIDFKNFAQTGESRDKLLYRLTKVVQKQRAVISFLAILIFLNFLLDAFQWK